MRRMEQLQILAPRALLARLEARATAERRPKAAIVREALEAFLAVAEREDQSRLSPRGPGPSWCAVDDVRIDGWDDW